MTDRAVDKHIRASQLPALSSGTLSSTELASVTEQAVSRCTKKFATYFKRKYGAAAEVPQVAFTDITDQYKKGTKVSISVATAIQFIEMDTSKTAYIECTAQKLNASSQWQVGFLER